jgi:hypothetical protein
MEGDALSQYLRWRHPLSQDDMERLALRAGVSYTERAAFDDKVRRALHFFQLRRQMQKEGGASTTDLIKKLEDVRQAADRLMDKIGLTNDEWKDLVGATAHEAFLTAHQLRKRAGAALEVLAGMKRGRGKPPDEPYKILIHNLVQAYQEATGREAQSDVRRGDRRYGFERENPLPAFLALVMAVRDVMGEPSQPYGEVIDGIERAYSE